MKLLKIFSEGFKVYWSASLSKVKEFLLFEITNSNTTLEDF